MGPRSRHGTWATPRWQVPAPGRPPIPLSAAYLSSASATTLARAARAARDRKPAMRDRVKKRLNAMSASADR